MGSKSSKMYDPEKAPALDRDEKGNVRVKAGKKAGMSKADETQSGTEGVPQHVKDQHAMRDMHHRHEMEHMAMNRKHEVEHSASKGDKAMIEKHISEHKEMNTRHLAELKKASSRANSNDAGVDPKDDKPENIPAGPKNKAKADDGGEKVKK